MGDCRLCLIFNQAGPITKTVEDAAVLLDIISDMMKDSTSSIKDKENLFENLNSSVKGIKIGIPKEFENDDLPAVLKKHGMNVNNY